MNATSDILIDPVVGFLNKKSTRKACSNHHLCFLNESFMFSFFIAYNLQGNWLGNISGGSIMKERVLPAYHSVLFSISNTRLVFTNFITHLAGLSNLWLCWKKEHAKLEADRDAINNLGGNAK